MTDFLLELLSEEIPARMQAKAEQDLARLLGERLSAAGLRVEAIETYSTPRRLALIARGLPLETEAVRDLRRGPRYSAPEIARRKFLESVGLSLENAPQPVGGDLSLHIEVVIEKPGRRTLDVLAEAVPAVIRAFPWPKSMRWGEASASTESPRWVRPLQGIVALLGEEIVEMEVAGIRSGAATVGHRFHHPGIITIGGAQDYAEKLRACHVVVDAGERQAIVREGAARAAAAAGLILVEDEGLVVENAGLTEWPVPLLGSYDPAFLDVPREVIQLTMRTNQKYFACTNPPRDGEGDHSPEANGGGGSEPGTHPPPSAFQAATSPSRGGLAPNFVCTANIEAADGGAAIVAGNEKVLAARLSDAKFFWEQDLKIPLEEQAEKLSQIVFHEKLGTVADKADRVAKLARWLVEEGIVKSSPARGGGPAQPVEGDLHARGGSRSPLHQPAAGPPPRAGEDLAAQAETAARLAKADLVTGMVGEFPELQGVIGGYLARAQGQPDAVADAVRDHYKPAGQGDAVPTAPVTVAVSLADKLDSLFAFFAIGEKPTGSKDPFALRRAMLGTIAILERNQLRFSLSSSFGLAERLIGQVLARNAISQMPQTFQVVEKHYFEALDAGIPMHRRPDTIYVSRYHDKQYAIELSAVLDKVHETASKIRMTESGLLDFFADRLKVQQREAGVRHDLIDAVFALGGEDDLVRLLARVRALQSFVETAEGADLLAGYKRAANILRKEGWGQAVAPAQAGASGREDTEVDRAEMPASAGMTEKKHLSYVPLPEEESLIAALDSAEPRAKAAVEAEDFEGAMAALASLRAPVDAFFDAVTVNDPDPSKRAARLALLARMRDAVHGVADFSRIEG